MYYLANSIPYIQLKLTIQFNSIKPLLVAGHWGFFATSAPRAEGALALPAVAKR